MSTYYYVQMSLFTCVCFTEQIDVKRYRYKEFEVDRKVFVDHLAITNHPAHTQILRELELQPLLLMVGCKKAQ